MSRRSVINWWGLLLPVLLGLAGGMMSALMGIGGGVIMVPMLVFFMACSQKEAQGLSLGYMVLTALVGFAAYCAMPDVHIELWTVTVLTIGGVLGALLGTAVVQHIPNYWLRKFFGLLMIAVAIRLLLVAPSEATQSGEPALHAQSVAQSQVGQAIDPVPLPESTPPVGPHGWHLVGLAVLMGMAGGFLSALLGIGGGVIMVPMLVFFLSADQKEAQGLSLGYMIVTALVGFLRYHSMKHVETDFRVVGLLSVGGIVGAYAGAAAVSRIPNFWLQKLFAVLMIVVAVKLLLDRRAPVVPAQVPARG